MTNSEFDLYKNQILMKTNGSNIHAVNNQLGIILCAIGMQNLCECDHEDVSYDEIIIKAKNTICYHIR